MAKSALNMLTRMSAYELKRFGVMTCSVDTGWVSSLRPHGQKRCKWPPLTVDDGAARILDPIVLCLDEGNERKFATGTFWRNYKKTPFL